MEGISIIVPVYNRIETTKKCISFIKEKNNKCVFEIIIVDNGSTDATQEVFSNNTLPFVPSRQGRGDINVEEDKPAIPSPLAGEGKGEGEYSKSITYIRNPENLGVSKALNLGAKAAKYDMICFMHNDVFVHEENWISKIYDFICKTPDAGIIGLYGAKTVRKDGSFRGKTIVHAIKDRANISAPSEKVAVIDGLLMAMKKSVFKATGGFDEIFSIHFYDKDISIQALKESLSNYVLDISFEHRCADTRKKITGENEVREQASKLFIRKWAGTLPADVSSFNEKISYIFKHSCPKQHKL